LVPPEDETCLAVAVARLVGDPDLRARMGQAGWATAQLYAWNKVAGRVLDYYQEVTRDVKRRAHLRGVLKQP
jgi:phosphatidylinositol alpha-mannosyltransferase